MKFKIIKDFSIFNERIFESLCIEVEFSNNNSALFISLYRPPSHNILPLSEHNEVFLETLENLHSNLSRVNKDVYILTDSNIDLLSINSNKLSSDYFNKLLFHGFCKTTYKATSGLLNPPFLSSVYINDVINLFCPKNDKSAK